MARHEHLRDVGLGVWHWGLEIDGALVSVVSYGTPCFWYQRGRLARIAKRARCGIVQLCRGGTRPLAPTGTASRLISLANKRMSDLKGPLFVVAYADENYGEVGTIYQACNAIYIGLTRPKGQANYIIHGRQMSGWLVRRVFGTRAREVLRRIDPSFKVQLLQPKHRYVMVAGPRKLRETAKRLLNRLALPYPKRNGNGRPHPSVASNGTAVHEREEGLA